MIREAILSGNTLKLIGKGKFGTAKLAWDRIAKNIII